MIKPGGKPVATAVLTWLTPDEGGRCSGPPNSHLYAATCVFPLGGEAEVQPGWPATADEMFSILLEEIEVLDASNERRYKVGFLAPELAKPYTHDGAELLIMEGPRVVAHGRIDTVFEGWQ